ncbi:MAG: hypothetical protein Q8W44_06410 [Candidatus Palauibacterales bacterium]|nr:hypothetical protein [Candidatus Palauibacterales bacterium]
MEQDSRSSDHLSLERISALLDEPGDDPRATEHLKECERCEREQERMRRMRMALSALGGVTPPEDEWEQIEPHLPDRQELEGRGEEDDVLPLFRSGWVGRVAAATLVFAVGLGAGLQLRDDGSPSGENPDRAVASGETGSSGATAGVGAETGRRGIGSAAGFTVADDGGPASLQRSSDYLSAAQRLESMVSGGQEVDVEPIDDPVAAAEEMARLEALAEAAREALREQPADPALNNFLFRVNERQESLRSRLGAAARLASMDYR